MLILTLIVSTTAILFLSYRLHKSQKWNREVVAERAKLEARLGKWLQEKRTINTELAQRNAAQRGDIESLEGSLARERAENREIRRELAKTKRSPLVSITFTARIPTDGWKKTEFKRGVGSCGKTVSALFFTESDDRYVITQRCSDGERKEFTYFKTDVDGRIELAYDENQ